MKRRTVMFFVLCVSILINGAFVAYAQEIPTATDSADALEATTSGDRVTDPAKKTYSQMLRDQRAERRALRPPLQTDVGDPETRNYSGRIGSPLANRLNPYIRRLLMRAEEIVDGYGQIIPRVNRNLDRLAIENGATITEAKTHAAQAAESLNRANKELAAAQEAYEAGQGDEDPSQDFKDMKNALIAMRGYLTDVESELTQAVTAIRTVGGSGNIPTGGQ